MRNAYSILVRKAERKDHLEDLGLGGEIMLEWILGKWCESVNWMHLTQDRDQWWAVVNTVMNLRVL
jgi:hypothetical protein